MSPQDYFLFFGIFGIFFMLCIVIMIHVNHQLMKSADKRLAQANGMVLKLSESCDKLSEVNNRLSAHYNDKIKELESQRDNWRTAYDKLLTRYTILEDHMMELASRPTINNSHTTNELS